MCSPSSPTDSYEEIMNNFNKLEELLGAEASALQSMDNDQLLAQLEKAEKAIIDAELYKTTPDYLGAVKAAKEPIDDHKAKYYTPITKRQRSLNDFYRIGQELKEDGAEESEVAKFLHYITIIDARIAELEEMKKRQEPYLTKMKEELKTIQDGPKDTIKYNKAKRQFITMIRAQRGKV